MCVQNGVQYLHLWLRFKIYVLPRINQYKSWVITFVIVGAYAPERSLDFWVDISEPMGCIAFLAQGLFRQKFEKSRPQTKWLTVWQKNHHRHSTPAKKLSLPAKRFVTPASRVISDRSTGGAEPSLTSVIGRERVYSGSYERIMTLINFEIL